MANARVRHVFAGATALAAAALLPLSSAGAHPVDCDSAVTSVPTAASFADWNDGCRYEAAPPARATSSKMVTASKAGRPGNRARGRLKQVGHEPLSGRGMNAAIAVHGDYAYIGSRTDGGHVGQPHGGIMVVDISDPSAPALQGPPLDAKPGESSRELRVWRSHDVLIVLNTNCGVGPTLHHCTRPSISNIRFYDIGGGNADSPRLLNQFDVDTHEFFLWEDPKNPDRALIFAGNASSTCGTRGGSPSCPFSVWDISDVPDGKAPTTLFTGLHGYGSGGLHSLTVSNDGRRAHFALLNGGYAVVDTSDFARGAAVPMPRPVTTDAGRPTWPGPGAHSAAKFWGARWAWVSDEVYGTATGAGHGCPWGWARMIDISDPSAPTVEAEYRLPENEPSSCAKWNPPRTSYSAHNPTLTPHIAFSTWHSGGLQAVGIGNPRRPYQLAEFMPEPLDEVMLEDPRLSSDPDTGRNEKVVMWSYPIIQDGLIYVVDLRNGLYVLKYRGAFNKEVRGIEFLDGNSNQGDVRCYDPVGRRPRSCG
jgi:hypothetical protein